MMRGTSLDMLEDMLLEDMSRSRRASHQVPPRMTQRILCCEAHYMHGFAFVLQFEGLAMRVKRHCSQSHLATTLR